MNTDIFLDCANLEQMREGRKNPLVKGFTTNPTLMAQAGITDYEVFALDALEIVDGLPISFEVFSDEWDDMERQARKIAGWGGNVNVKIPISDTKGNSSVNLIRKLSDENIKCNVTAVLTLAQVEAITDVLNADCDAIISIFAGRIADAGIDPLATVKIAVDVYSKRKPKTKILWASPRQSFDICRASGVGCHIITVTPDLLKKRESSYGKDLTQFSLETCQMFYNDAAKAGYKLYAK